ncbi:MAG: class I SAM-dependent methyltransferase [Polaribacter sp.]|nr:class I SAM-dependent methyltransferase [Polaribacter sp.]
MNKIKDLILKIKFKMTEYFKAAKRILIDKFNQYYFSGSLVKCEMCNWEGSKFPSNNRCPKCRSLARTRLIPFSIKYFNTNSSIGNILHIAPNLSEYNFVKKNLEYTNYDRLNISGKAKHINVIQDLTKMNITSGTYNQIIAWHVLEHIQDDQKAIREMYRVLKKGGELLLSVPIYPKNNHKTIEIPGLPRKKYKEVHGHFDHCRSCGLDYFKRFEREGFKTKTLNVSELDYSQIKKYGLSDSHTVWNFTK